MVNYNIKNRVFERNEKSTQSKKSSRKNTDQDHEDGPCYDRKKPKLEN